MAEAKKGEYNDHKKAKKREDLQPCRDKIKQEKPKKSDFANSVPFFLQPSHQKHWKRIKYFEGKFTGEHREEFQKYLEKGKEVTSLKHAGPHAKHNDSRLGLRWHKRLSDVLKKSTKRYKSVKCKKELAAARELVQSLQEQFGVELVDCDFPLYGYVYNREKMVPDVSLWQDAKADAIGCHKESGKFVIVEWKVKNLLTFWKDYTTYGMYLHQSLVYARLLQLHMGLPYLPPILLVPISFFTGKDILPGMFCDYPNECKDAIESDVWSTTLPKPPLKIQAKAPFSNALKVGEVPAEMPVTALFAKDATVKDFLKVVGYESLQVRKNGIEGE